MPTGHYRFRRSLGNVASLFRGARPDTFPLFTGLLDDFPNAAAAYSLRALTRNWVAGDVVEVRRSSDSSTDSFTESQILSGAMLSFVKKPGDFTNDGANPFEVLSNNGTGDGFSATNTFGVGLAKSGLVTGTTSDMVTITFDILLTSGSPSINLRQGDIVRSSSVAINTSGSKSIDLTATGTFDNFTFGDADIPSEFTISNVRFSTANGFVSTNYDQSGATVRDATQATTTQQPKIVDAGAVVLDGNGNTSTLWDGIDDDLDVLAGFAGLTSANVYAVTDNAGVVTIDTLTAQDISLATNLSTILTSLIYDKVTAVIIYPDATDQAGIEAKLSDLFE